MPTTDWLTLVANLPTEDPAIRMRVLRTLESLGAAVLRDGVFLMPDNAASRQALEHLADYVNKNTGVAYILHVAASSPEQGEAFRALFDRSARYEALVKNITSLKVGFGMADPSAISRVLRKQRDEFEILGALDFFPNEARRQAEQALVEAEAAVHKLLFPAHAQAVLTPGDRLLGRTWATRKPLWADRLACAWLIRRFVDPEATLVWLDKRQACPDKAIGFAFPGAHFSNSAERVTYEEMLQRLNLARHSALKQIGAIVHFLEVRDTPVPEAAGVETLLQGALRRAKGEDALLREAEKTFDLLYEAYEDVTLR